MNALPRAIGLWSPAPGCGKSSTAEIITDHFPRYSVLPFAQPLKQMLQPFLCAAGYTQAESYDLLNTSSGKSTILEKLPGRLTPRHLLRTLGTEWGRNLQHPDVWIAIWQSRAACHTAVIADDLRFNEEALAIKALGGQIWAITRSGYHDTSGHPSEAGIDPSFIDVVIHNDSDLFDLEVQVMNAFSTPTTAPTNVS